MTEPKILFILFHLHIRRNLSQPYPTLPVPCVGYLNHRQGVWVHMGWRGRIIYCFAKFSVTISIVGSRVGLRCLAHLSCWRGSCTLRQLRAISEPWMWTGSGACSGPQVLWRLPHTFILLPSPGSRPSLGNLERFQNIRTRCSS